MIRDEKGQSLIEFALLVPLFLLLICGTVDFGRLMYAYLHLNLAAQESVRMGGLGKTDEEITAFAKGYVHIANASALTVTITPSQASRKSGDYVTVKLVSTVPFITPVIANLLPKPVVAADSTIRVE
jgi:Flp pilus assembly protein TadG